MGAIARLVRRFAPSRPAAQQDTRAAGSAPVAAAIPDSLILVDHPHWISLPFVRHGSGVAIATSSPRHSQHPAWSDNLLTNTWSTVIVDGHEVAVRARLARSGEAHGLLPKLIEVWPPLRTYLKEVEEHCVRLFILEPC